MGRLHKTGIVVALLLSLAAHARSPGSVNEHFQALKTRIGEPKRWAPMASPVGLTRLSELFRCDECVERLASRSHMNVKSWVTESYLYRLSSAAASLHANFGIFPEFAPERTWVAIDENTGEVERFFLTGLHESAIDPAAAMAHELGGDFSRLNTRLEASRIASLIRPFSAHVPEIALYGEFLSLYRRTVERMTLRNVILEDAASDLWHRFQFANRLADLWVDGARKFTSVEDAFEFLMTAIAEGLHRARMEELYARLKDVPRAPIDETARAALSRIESEGGLTFAGEEARARWKEFANPSTFQRLRNSLLGRSRATFALVEKDRRAYVIDDASGRLLAVTTGEKTALCAARAQ